jgi:crotonobetainyl-CoA:carnitine CoA-transferase CaiB-like acyl-CoA transferase
LRSSSFQFEDVELGFEFRRRKLHAEFLSIVPYQVFHASDRAFVLAVASERLWADTCAALGREPWRDDPRFRDNAARVANRDTLCSELARLFAGDTASRWLALFENAGIPAAPVNTVRQALEHPVAHARGMRIEADGVPMVGSPLKLSASPFTCRRPPPGLGEHSDELVHAHGFDPAALRAQGAIA